MPHARSLGGFRHRLVSYRNLRPAVNKKEGIDFFKCRAQCCRVSEIACRDVDTISEARLCLFHITHKDARPLTIPNHTLNNLGPNISRRARDQILHPVSSKASEYKYV